MLHPLDTTISTKWLRVFMNSPAPLDSRDQPLYPAAEAALYVEVPAHVMTAWIDQKLLRTPAGSKILSYNNLIEAFILKTIRADGVKGKNLAEAVRVLGKLNQESSHPLFDAQLRTDGNSLFLQEWSGSVVVNLSKGGQHAFPNMVRKHLTRVEWDRANLPTKFFPRVGQKASKIVVLQPGFGSGRPTIVDRGILVSVLYRRWESGESVKDLAEDYDLRSTEVQAAVDYHGQIAA
jgi:uncharacterized protein (DUF433 family)